MSAAANKALIYRLYEEAFMQGNLSIVDELFCADFVDRSTPEQPPGREGVKDYISMVRSGFPDISIAIEDLIAEEDKVVVRTIWRGTHLGEYAGAAPSGRQVTGSIIQIFHLRDGKLSEEWFAGESLL
jgi:steroid delta-isomerase-like uncharacterized protein